MLGIMQASTFALVFYYLLVTQCQATLTRKIVHLVSEMAFLIVPAKEILPFAKQQNLWKEHQANLQRRAHEHIGKGYEMDPGGRRFHIVEQTYFERTANIHTEDVEAQLSYGVLLRGAQKYDKGSILSTSREIISGIGRLRHGDAMRVLREEELRAPDQSRRKWMELRTKQVEEVVSESNT